MNYAKQVRICEVSTRDGFQTLPPIAVADKVKLLDLMADAGIREIEVGSFLGERSGVDSMRSTPEVFQKMNRRPGVVYRALLQTPAGMREAADAGCPKVKINISGSGTHYRLMTGKSIAEGMEGFREIGAIAARHQMTLLGSISLAFVSPYDGWIPSQDIKEIIRRFIDCGASEISLNDTAGMAFPNQVRERFLEMKAEFPEIRTWAFHAHNTRGTGLANVLAALDAGVDRIDSSLAGIGGCTVFKNASGNIATEDTVYMLNGMGIKTGIDLEKAIKAGEFVESLVDPSKTDSYIQRLEKIKRQGNGIE